MSVASYESRPVRWLRYSLIIAVTFVVLFPLLWIVLSSLKPRPELFTVPPKLFPDQITFKHYREVLTTSEYYTYFFNSIVVTVTTTIVATILAVFAGYGWSKFEFFGSETTSSFVILSRTLPLVVLVIPIFKILSEINLIDSYIGLILAYMIIVLPLTSWLLKGFFDNIPDNIIQAARIDGLSELEIFYNIALPIVTPGIAATAVFSFVLIWQELLFALSILQTDSKLTMPVLLLKQTTVYSIDWPTLLTLSVLFMLPAMVLFFLTQNYLIRGMTGGTVD